MGKNRNNNQTGLNTVMWILFFFLIGVGVILIIQSYGTYNHSLQQESLITQKMLDISFRKTAQTLIPIPTANYSTIKDGYSQALSFFTLALAALLILLLLPRLQTFSINPTGITFTLKDLQEQVTQLKIQNNELQANTVDAGGGKTFDEVKAHEVKILMNETKKPPTKVSDDPQKNQWGGKPVDNGRRLSAVIRNSLLPSFYEVDLIVAGTSDNPLTGLVTFHLHDTFKNQTPVISVINGEAILRLKKVYGAFTVGAVADSGVTRLELDLSELQGAPKEFKER